ncbi:hypothetical protein [Photobacterium halotolerans]|uniref:hypothetical protein n=1 Tax=Photobacterium halotolerans TaxID=265726 RepID=UPI0013723D58|nr:hypothetical protein [Photobacterium halotolerans]NAW85497.1 hypothetical protein [Photobacterium halotolerans]
MKPSGDAFVYSQLKEVCDEVGIVVTSVTYNGARVKSYTEGNTSIREKAGIRMPWFICLPMAVLKPQTVAHPEPSR